METRKSPIHESPQLLCTWDTVERCKHCRAEGKLSCRFEGKKLAFFLMIFLPYGVITVIGMLRSGFGWALILWLAYALFFFFIWEARVLCRHCPYWDGQGQILHCPANYCVIKVWRYQPKPMRQGEKVQFIIGALILTGFPFPFLAIGKNYLFITLGIISLTSFIILLRRYVCSRCINFSCPLNTVPKVWVDIYLRENSEIRKAWESCGYELDQ